jgi:CDP-diacylglycerol--glycerol-3-phosphate 3-phosphatidyltransferase/cardiolipin synthase
LSSADLKRLPNLVSLLRIPLAVVFPWVADRPVVALAVICLAGGTDVLDGWLARKGGQATAVGAVIDPIADKVFAIVVVGTLVVHGRMPLWAIAAMLVREILEAPLLVWVLVSAKKRRARRMQARANIPGKAATVVQFGAVASALLWPSILEAMLVLAALCGMVAGVSYWRRELMGTAEGQSV